MKKFTLLLIALFVFMCALRYTAGSTYAVSDANQSKESISNKTTSDEYEWPGGCRYGVYLMPYELDNGYVFSCFQVFGLGESLERKVNDSLTKHLPLLSGIWFGENTYQLIPVIHLQSPRYLSVEYSFGLMTAENVYWRLCVTVDVQSGEVVCLDDLVDLDQLSEDFPKQVEGGQNIVTYLEPAFDNFWTAEELSKNENEFMAEMGSEYIRSYFRDFTTEYLYGDYYVKNDYNMESEKPHLYRTYFYLEDGAIRCTPPRGGMQLVKIDTDDITEYLKVPKW